MARDKRQKKEEMIKRWKAEFITAKWHRTRGEISLSSEDKNENDNRDDMDPDQANNIYPLLL